MYLCTRLRAPLPTVHLWSIHTSGAHIADDEIRQAEDKFAESLQLAQIGMFNLLDNDVSKRVDCTGIYNTFGSTTILTFKLIFLLNQWLYLCFWRFVLVQILSDLMIIGWTSSTAHLLRWGTVGISPAMYRDPQRTGVCAHGKVSVRLVAVAFFIEIRKKMF